MPHCVTGLALVVHNPSPKAKILGDSVYVGSAQPCADPLATTPAFKQLPDEADVKVHVVQSQMREAQPVDERGQKLAQMLNICESNLSSEDAKRLKSQFLEASDVFAVEKDEIGTVMNVQHCIETGPPPPHPP